MTPQTEAEELAAAARAIGRKLDDIAIADRPDAPRDMRYFATWGPYDLDCLTGSGMTEQEAMWDLIWFTLIEPDVQISRIRLSDKDKSSMIFCPCKTYKTARRRYPRAQVIARVDGGFWCFALRADYIRWKRRAQL